MQHKSISTSNTVRTTTAIIAITTRTARTTRMSSSTRRSLSRGRWRPEPTTGVKLGKVGQRRCVLNPRGSRGDALDGRMATSRNCQCSSLRERASDDSGLRRRLQSDGQHMVLAGGQVTSIQACQNQGCVAPIVGASAGTAATSFTAASARPILRPSTRHLRPATTDDAGNELERRNVDFGNGNDWDAGGAGADLGGGGPTIADGTDRRRH